MQNTLGNITRTASNGPLLVLAFLPTQFRPAIPALETVNTTVFFRNRTSLPSLLPLNINLQLIRPIPKSPPQILSIKPPNQIRQNSPKTLPMHVLRPPISQISQLINMLRFEQILQTRENTRIKSPPRSSGRRRVVCGGGLQRFRQSADFFAGGHRVGGLFHFYFEFEARACVHACRSWGLLETWAWMLEGRGCDERVPVAVVWEIEEGIVDCGWWRIDYTVA
jgi:hypothetical protein